MGFYEELAETSLKKAIQHSEEAVQSLALQLAKEASVQALQEIRAVLDDDSLDDPACFQRIEKIVGIFENLHSNAGSRHDFG